MWIGFIKCHWWAWLLVDVFCGVLVALLLRQFACLLCLVKGRSMMDTLQNGDIVFALRRKLCGEIHRFDVVLCKYPNRKGLFVKRVVGLPGECIWIDEDVLYINGEPVAENFPRRKCLRPMGEKQIGMNEYFVLGDNRPASRDSRSVGTIPLESIIAVVKCVVFPFGKIRKIR